MPGARLRARRNSETSAPLYVCYKRSLHTDVLRICASAVIAISSTDDVGDHFGVTPWFSLGLI